MLTLLLFLCMRHRVEVYDRRLPSSNSFIWIVITLLVWYTNMFILLSCLASLQYTAWFFLKFLRFYNDEKKQLTFLIDFFAVFHHLYYIYIFLICSALHCQFLLLFFTRWSFSSPFVLLQYWKDNDLFFSTGVWWRIVFL